MYRTRRVTKGNMVLDFWGAWGLYQIVLWEGDNPLRMQVIQRWTNRVKATAVYEYLTSLDEQSIYFIYQFEQTRIKPISD